MHNSSNNRFAAICSKANYRWVFGILFLFTLLELARFALPVNAAKYGAYDWNFKGTENYDRLGWGPHYQQFIDGMETASDVIKRVSPAIVSIEVRSTVVPSSERLDDIDPLKDFFVPHEFLPNYPYYQPWLETPSHKGLIFDPAGYIVTNTHVIKDAIEILVTLSDGSQYEAKLVAGDHRTDLSVLKIEVDEDLDFAEFGDSDRLHDGDWVIAVEDEFVDVTGMDSLRLPPRMSMLRVVSISNEYGTAMLKYSSQTNKGNFGAPLLTYSGEIIGINVFKPSAPYVVAPMELYGLYESTAVIRTGSRYAIPSNTIKFVTSSILETGKVEYGYLGVLVERVDRTLSNFPASKEPGVLIAAIERNSPAEPFLNVGEIVLKYEGKEVRSVDEFVNFVQLSRPGELVQLHTWHEGELRTVTVRIGVKKFDRLANRSTTDDTGSSTLSTRYGLHIGEIDENYQREQQLDKSVNGLLVLDVEPSRTAEAAGLQPGDVIRKIDNRSFTAINNAVQYLGERQRDKEKVPMYLHRNSIDQFLVFDTTDLS